ncbi:hypothetical protein CEQ90_19920 [Lewinellaceae bacterium SD302]|nr:hypothetical protein CEQ90_19920 [Lewinellaceae bacterium SD302]
MKYSLIIVLLIFSIENRNSTIDDVDISALTPELYNYCGSIIDTEVGYNIESSTMVDKFNSSMYDAISERDKNIQDFNKSINTGLFAFKSTTALFSEIPGTSAFSAQADMIAERYVESATNEFEKKEKQKVKESLLGTLEFIENQSDRESLRKLIQNDYNPFFETSNPGTIYNNKLIQFVDKMRAQDKQMMQSALLENENRVNELYEKQEQFNNIVIDLEIKAFEHYEENRRIIEKNKLQIRKNKDNIEINTKLIEQNALRVSILEATVVNHEYRIKGLEIENKYNKLSLEKKLDGLKTGEFDRLFTNEGGVVNEEEKSKLIRETEDLKLRSDINYVAQNVSEWGAVGSAALKTFFSDDVPEEIIETVDFAVQAGTIVSAFASQNYAAGALQVIGLFGKKSNRDPNTLLLKRLIKQVQQVRKEMHQRFNRLEKKIDFVHEDLSQRLDSISAYLVMMNKDIRFMHSQSMLELNIIQSDLQKIIKYIECNDRKIGELIRKDLFVCEGPYQYLVNSNQNDPPRGYSDFIKKARISRCESCLNNLRNFLSSFNYSTHVFDSERCDINLLNSTISQRDVYNNLLALWKTTWGESYEDMVLIETLFIPEKVSDNLRIFSLLRENRVGEDNYYETNNLIQSEILDNKTGKPNVLLKNVDIIERITNYLIVFYDYLLVQKERGDYLAIEEIAEGKIYKEYSEYQARYLKYMLDIIDYSLMQQSLMSGHLSVPYFTGYLDSDDEGIANLAIEVLENNPVLSRNLVNYWLSNNQNFRKNNSRYLLVDRKRLKVYIDNFNGNKTAIVERDFRAPKPRKVVNIQLAYRSNSIDNSLFLFSPSYFKLKELRNDLNEKILEVNLMLGLTVENEPSKLSIEDFKLLNPLN